MADATVEFLLEAVLGLPRPADLDLCEETLALLASASSPKQREGPVRWLAATFDFPEGRADAYVTLARDPTEIPAAWRARLGPHSLRVAVACHRVPQARAEAGARAFFERFGALAEALEATSGYVDVGERQARTPAPTPWAEVQAPKRALLHGLLGKAQPRVVVRRQAPFPEGFTEGRAGFPPPKPVPVPACILVAGAALEEGPDAAERARGAGLGVWVVPLLGKPAVTLAGVRVATLPLSRSEVEVDPAEAADRLDEARKGFARMGAPREVGLLLAQLPEVL